MAAIAKLTEFQMLVREERSLSSDPEPVPAPAEQTAPPEDGKTAPPEPAADGAPTAH